MRTRLLALPILLLTGCVSTAGPFVTNISVAGPGVLRVERCDVEFSPWGYNHIENGECSEELVQVGVPAPVAVPRASPITAASASPATVVAR